MKIYFSPFVECQNYVLYNSYLIAFYCKGNGLINFGKNKIPISNIPMNNLLGPHIQRQSLWSILIINEDIRNFPISFNQVLAFSTSNVIKY